jgi:hypothetical protein
MAHRVVTLRWMAQNPAHLALFGGRNEFVLPVLNLRRCLMKQDPIEEHAASEALPTETERSYGVLTAGVIALVVVGTAFYWIS